MKNYSTLIALAFAGGILFSSCSRIGNISVSKRHYRSGFYVDLGSKPQTAKTTEAAQPAQAFTPESKPVNTETPSAVVAPKKVTVQQPLASSPEKKRSHTNHVYASNQPGSVDQKAIHQELREEQVNTVAEAMPPVTNDTSSDMPQWALILFAIILPPLAVGLKFGIVTQFWISIILTLLFWIPGVIYALILILQ